MTDIEKVKLYVPIEFWTNILMTLDKKVEVISQQYGYGKVNLQLTIQNGCITQTIFTDEVIVRSLPGQPTPSKSKSNG